MSLALIEDLGAATTGLKRAMQGSDLSDIEKAMARFRTSLEAVQAVGAWRSDPALKARVGELMKELESSRMLACLLGDMSGQLHAAIAAQHPDAPQPLYGPR
jgi:hypothetical protein